MTVSRRLQAQAAFLPAKRPPARFSRWLGETQSQSGRLEIRKLSCSYPTSLSKGRNVQVSLQEVCRCVAKISFRNSICLNIQHLIAVFHYSAHASRRPLETYICHWRLPVSFGHLHVVNFNHFPTNRQRLYTKQAIYV